MNKVIEDCKHAVQEIEKIMCAQALKNVVIDNHEPGVVEEEVNKTQESEASILHSSENKPSEPLPNNHIRQRRQRRLCPRLFNLSPRSQCFENYALEPLTIGLGIIATMPEGYIISVMAMKKVLH